MRTRVNLRDIRICIEMFLTRFVRRSPLSLARKFIGEGVGVAPLERINQFDLLKRQLSTMYSTVERGTPESTNYRIFFSKCSALL